MEIKSTLPVTFQYIYIILLVLSFIALLKNDNNVALLNIILCGCALLFIIIETQSRYSYIVSWIFIVFAAVGIERTFDFIRKGIRDGFKFREKIK